MQLSEASQIKVRNLKAEIDTLNRLLTVYLQGIIDNAGLVGKHTLNFETWELTATPGEEVG